MLTLLREIGDIQDEYRKLVKTRMTKQDLCNLVIPFRDRYGFTDSEALSIVRDQITISEMVQLFEKHQDNKETHYANHASHFTCRSQRAGQTP